MKRDVRNAVLGAVVVCAVVAGGIFGYREIFTKGLDRLSEKVCDGAVSRETVVEVLPDARAADDDAGVTGEGRNFFFGCRVHTSENSTLSGESELSDAASPTWVDHYKRDGETATVSSGRVEALATSDLATVYLPCVPQGVQASEAVQSYAITTEVRVLGTSRVHGAELRQSLTDFAYELARYSYRTGKCKNRLMLPKHLPRYESAGS